VPATTRDERRAAASKASLARLAGLDEDGRRHVTEAARAALRARDLNAVDPERKLDPDERERQLVIYRRQRMAEVTLASVRARRRTAAERGYRDTLALLQAAGFELEDLVELGEYAAGYLSEAA
jgi:hypothetical protein